MKNYWEIKEKSTGDVLIRDSNFKAIAFFSKNAIDKDMDKEYLISYFEMQAYFDETGRYRSEIKLVETVEPTDFFNSL